MHSFRRRSAVLAAAALATAVLLPGGGSASAGSTASAHAATTTTATATAKAIKSPGNVLANLFEWNWPSVGQECTDVLGPAGYAGVQVSPPQDSVKRTELGNGSDTILHPWWEVYQAVDYNLTSRMGNEQQFKDMVTTCRAAGVKVYVDAVINHMTGQGSLSYGGVTFGRYDYPGLYTQDNFHKFSGDCPSASGGIEDFNNQQQVFNCELLGLADLRTDTNTVRNTLADYLNKLIGYGVSGFRVDAAKHIGQTDLAAIYNRLHKTKDGEKPLWALEVFGGGPGTLSPMAFTPVGTVLGLDAVRQIRDAFKSYPAEHIGSIATLKVFGEGSGLTPSASTLSFVQNHDTERNGDALSYKDGATNLIANEFLLAYNYGTPQIYSGFAFSTNDDSPPATDDGLITDTDCSAATWVCVVNNTGVRNMVGWHNTVGSAPIKNWWDNGGNLISFSRGSKGWISINNDAAAHTGSFQTGLAGGTYCDTIHGSLSGATCSGPSVTVDSHGLATVTVPSKDAVAFSVADLMHH
jgi:alpha-amylase